MAISTTTRRGLHGELASDSLPLLAELDLLETAPPQPLLSPGQRQRYDRQLIYWADLADSGESAEALQQRLANSTVVVLGCGGLGSVAAMGLASAGVGRLILIDGDQVDTSNLNRQLLYSESDVGRPKVEAAAEALRRHNSDLEVVAIRCQVSGSQDLADPLVSADFLVFAADWPPYELPAWVNRACLAAEVPFIGAGQFPPLVRVGPTVIPGHSACLACLERQTRRTHPLYQELAAQLPRPSTAATLGAASGVAGSLMAMEAIHLLTDAVGPASVDRAVIVDLRTLTLRSEELRRDPECPECRLARVPARRRKALRAALAKT